MVADVPMTGSGTFGVFGRLKNIVKDMILGI